MIISEREGYINEILNINNVHGYLEKSTGTAYLNAEDVARGFGFVKTETKNGVKSEETLQRAITSPDFLIKLATELKQEQNARKLAEQQVKELTPKGIFADAVNSSETSILIGELAKLLKQNGVNMGRNRLFDWMKNNGYLIKSGSERNMPTQKSMEMKLLEIKERNIANPDGSIKIVKTPKVTGKGQIYFINKLLAKEV